MNDDDRFEEDLRARFRAMREVEARRVPPFPRTRTGRPHREQRRLLPSPAWRSALAALAVVALVMVAWAVRSARQEAETRRVLARWSQVSAGTLTMPTDFLLDSPGQSLLREVPKLGRWDTYWFWDVPSRGPSQPRIHPSKRRQDS